MLRKTIGGRASLPRRARSARFIPFVVAWQVVLVAAFALVLQRQVWAFAAAGLVLLAALLLTLPVNGRTLVSSLRMRRAFGLRQRERVAHPDLAPQLVPLGQWLPRIVVTQIKDAHDGEIGVVADGQSWVGILGLSADNSLFTDRGIQLDLTTLGDLIRQDDVVFAGIQVVTLTIPAPSGALLPGNSPALVSYGEATGAATPPAMRRTWIALRLDPRLCLEAVGRRGSGEAGVFAALRFGLHRAQAMLKRHGVIADPLDPQDIADVLGMVTGAGDDPQDDPTQERWESWLCDTLVHEARAIGSFGANPNYGYQRLLDVTARAPVLFACASLTVCPGEPVRGALRLVTPNQEQARLADEFVHTGLAGELPLGPRGGIQVPGMLASVPLARQVQQWLK